MGVLQSSHSLPNRIFWEDFGPLIPSKCQMISLVPDDGFEPQTNGLQNR
jgi:hypothetical protein